MKRIVILGLAFGFILPGVVAGQSENPTRIGGQWYLSYRAGESNGQTFNRFGIDRGYINIRHTLTERWSGRITPDVTVR